MLSNTYVHHVDYSWIKEYYREIKEYNGNMQNYIDQDLNFSPDQQELLKSKYLVSNDGKNTPYPAHTTSVTSHSVPSYVAPVVTQPANKTTESVKPDTNPVAHKAEVESTPLIQPDKTVTKHKKVRTKIKIVSVKKIKKAKFVHLKGHRAYFYDMKLKHKVGKSGKTGKTPKAQWRLLKKAKIRINGKTKTYVEVKSPHGKKRWIQLKDVSMIKPAHKHTHVTI